MVDVSNNKIILRPTKYSLEIFTLKVDEGNILTGFTTFFGSLVVSFA